MNDYMMDWFDTIDGKKVEHTIDHKIYTPVYLEYDSGKYQIVCFNESMELEFIDLGHKGDWVIVEDSEEACDACDHEWIDVGFMQPAYVCKHCDKEK